MISNRVKFRKQNSYWGWGTRKACKAALVPFVGLQNMVGL